MIARRTLVLALAGTALAGRAAAAPLAARLQALEARSKGRLGLAVLDGDGRLLLGHKSDERFPMCSTFKVLLAGAVLARVDAGRERLDRRVTYSASDLLSYAPAARAHLAEGMTVDQLCEAAVTLSDNTAANLLLKNLGGPAALTAWLRSVGDRATRLDRWEPELNTAIPGDPRDTTTPAAMAASLGRLTLGTPLAPASRQRLVGWLVANKTGDKRLRAGLPKDWRVGDKTGTGADVTGTSNDVAVVWRPDGRPALIAAYLTRAVPDGDARDLILAEAGRIAAATLV